MTDVVLGVSAGDLEVDVFLLKARAPQWKISCGTAGGLDRDFGESFLLYMCSAFVL